MKSAEEATLWEFEASSIKNHGKAVYIIIAKGILIHTFGVMRYNTAMPC